MVAMRPPAFAVDEPWTSDRLVTSRSVDRAALTRWIEAYERAWRTRGVDALVSLFTEDATYRTAPFEEPFRGLPAIAAMWEEEREGPGEAFELESEVVAVEGDTGVVRLEVRYGDPAPPDLP